MWECLKYYYASTGNYYFMQIAKLLYTATAT